MIFPIFSLSSLLALLALSANASPLSLQLLSLRDVVAPKIITPNAQTVWPIGTTQTVTWDTSQLPPVSQITNPTGKVILGFNSSDSLNLDFNHPLASGFQITSGSVQIVVPNVTPRTDYLIVLFGDSGNTSPSFAITQISGGSSSSSSSHAGSSPTTSAADNAASTSTLITTPIPITGSVITGGSGTSTDSVPASATVSDTASSATATSPASSSGFASASSSGSAASASSTAASSTSAAWSVHRTDNNSVMSFKTFSMCMVSAIMLVMTS